MNEFDESRLRDMLDAALTARQFIEGKTRDMLETDRMFNFALIRAVEVIGEAANRITAETRRQLPNLPWQAIIGMRNRIAHQYLEVDNNIVWDTVVNDLPLVIAELKRFISPEDQLE